MDVGVFLGGEGEGGFIMINKVWCYWFFIEC